MRSFWFFVLFFFFFLMIRRPPRSTLFPTRRSSDLRIAGRKLSCAGRCQGHVRHRSISACATRRSEEHTSELQSHSDLVCRLLLEKKKKNEIILLSIKKKKKKKKI